MRQPMPNLSPAGAPCYPAAGGIHMSDAAAAKRVRQFRQILLWPLQLMPLKEGNQIQRHWEVLNSARRGQSVARGRRRVHRRRRAASRSATTTSSSRSCRTCSASSTAKAARERRRRTAPARRCACSGATTSRAVRVVAAAAATPPVTLEVAHVDLYFFYDIDVVLLNVEVDADDLPLDAGAGHAVPLRPRLSRPAGTTTAEACTAWHQRRVARRRRRGAGARPTRSEREKFLAFVGEHRAPRIASHWAYLLQPLVQRPFRASAGRCAIARSSTTACR